MNNLEDFLKEYIELCLKYKLAFYGFDDGLHIKEFDFKDLGYDFFNTLSNIIKEEKF